MKSAPDETTVTPWNYTDFRLFIRDRIAYLKQCIPGFSYRTIAETAGFSSAGLLTQIIQGSTNLSSRLVSGFAAALKLKKREARYFALMVQYNQAQDHDEKKACFEQMLAFKKGLVRTLDPGSYEYYDKWYYSAIRTILFYHAFDGDYTRLAHMIVPAISAAEARKAVRVLLRLGLVQKKEDGGYALTDMHLTTGHHPDSLMVNLFVTNTLDIAKNALDRFPRDFRHFSALTVGVSAQGYEAIRQRLDQTRAEIADIVRNDRGIDRVYQVNFQAFPLTYVAGGMPDTQGETV